MSTTNAFQFSAFVMAAEAAASVTRFSIACFHEWQDLTTILHGWW
ncbi:MAG: hypothetical protein WBO17_06310 [Sphingorhabdus sp.]